MCLEGLAGTNPLSWQFVELWWHQPSSLSHWPAETCSAATPGKAKEAAFAWASRHRRHNHTGREKSKKSRGKDWPLYAAHRCCHCLMLGFASTLSLLLSPCFHCSPSGTSCWCAGHWLQRPWPWNDPHRTAPFPIQALTTSDHIRNKGQNSLSHQGIVLCPF